MTYSESANGQIITRARALKELRDHDCAAPEDLEMFFFDMGDQPIYDAGEVLAWLGY